METLKMKMPLAHLLILMSELLTEKLGRPVEVEPEEELGILDEGEEVFVPDLDALGGSLLDVAQEGQMGEMVVGFFGHDADPEAVPPVEASWRAVSELTPEQGDYQSTKALALGALLRRLAALQEG